ncbi:MULTISPECIES: alpha-ketoglutarate-dependent dioxygenase AlkB [unclassified Cyanobium]|uniref:alpha-ketoglutarate-dependent dioxygenase AlkB family protein n=1 Tax=unclassified Cyanobium TaxID=2627006 RepID=UPI00164709A5|nr:MULTISPECIES: alpha-ketoglutarate-dependent dioxygenase AlkB [unclassified Cyanobium]MBE9154261.1 alpha-ketoglutarate-dependent dioxygenase AlkB [Cyanobium sp. LEGE 06113]QNI70194.1 alpha-ketoglutarate-dependent dioxygenase/ AlkB-like superfamily [Cyanobium sp. NS01]
MSGQLGIFDPSLSAAPHTQELPGLALRFWPSWAGPGADRWMEQLRREVPWKHDSITLFGCTHPVPRLTCWVGDPGCSYTYSGVADPIEPWSPLLQQLRERVQTAAGCRFNSLLLNRYRDGRDAMGWHADNEPELDPRAPIASLSFGAPRSFRLKPRAPGRNQGKPLVYELGHGDLLVMDPPTQEHWLHQVPRRLRLRQERINLTFRRIRSAAPPPWPLWSGRGRAGPRGLR